MDTKIAFFALDVSKAILDYDVDKHRSYGDYDASAIKEDILNIVLCSIGDCFDVENNYNCYKENESCIK